MRVIVIDQNENISFIEKVCIEAALSAEVFVYSPQEIFDHIDNEKDDIIVGIEYDDDYFQNLEGQILESTIPYIKIPYEEFGLSESIIFKIQTFFEIDKDNKRWFSLKKETVLLSDGHYDIYIKISDNKYVKIHSAHGLNFKDSIDNYFQKGIEFFFLHKEDFGYFLESTKRKLLSKESTTEQMNYQKSSIELVQEKVRKLGIRENVVSDVNLVVDAIVASIYKRKDHLIDLIQKIKGNDYLYEHCLLISYVAPLIAENLGLYSKSFNEKIVFVALFHDVTLIDQEKKYLDAMNENSFDHLSWQVIKKIKNHPLAAVNIVKSISNTPPDVEMIIMNHHEKEDGSGYPKGLVASQIPLMAAVFIVCEDFCHRIYRLEVSALSIEIVLEDMKKSYTQGVFKKTFQALETAISKAAL